MASVVVRPTVVDFMDRMMHSAGATLRMEELPLESMPSLIGGSLRDADLGRRTGVLVLALKTEDRYRFNPGAQTIMGADDLLIVMGTLEQLAALKALQRSP